MPGLHAPGIVRRNTTFARISFFSHKPALNRTDVAEDSVFDQQIQESSLVQMSFNKRIGEATGRVTIVLKPYKKPALSALGRADIPWVDLVEEGDWWMIDIEKNGKKTGLAFGKVDRVNLTFSANKGEGQGLVTIEGRDIGFALEDTPLYFNPHDPAIDNALGINMLAVLKTIFGPTSSVVVSMIKGLMGKGGVAPILGGHIEVPAGLMNLAVPQVKWADLVDFTTNVQLGLRGAVFAANAISPQGAPSVWEFVNEWRNPVMNEMWLDTVPTSGVPKKATLILREKPFVRSTSALAWNNLKVWNVDASMIVSANLSRGDNRVNHAVVVGDLLPGLGNDVYAINVPKADIASIRKFGLKRMEETTRYFDDTGQTATAASFQEWTSLIVSWNVLNHEYWQGSITLGEMRPEIRVGQKIAIASGPLAGYLGLPSGHPRYLTANFNPLAFTFYVEGVQHTYTEGPNPTAQTQLMVSRGFVDGERQPRIAAESLKWALPLPPLPSVNVPVTQNVGTPVDQALADNTGFDGEYPLGDHSAEPD